MAKDHGPGIQRQATRLVYENAYLTLYDDPVRFPTGVSGTYVRAVWRAPWSVAVLAVTAAQEYVLIRTFSYATGRWLLQLPKGFGSVQFSPRQQAEAELIEETGYSAASWVMTAELHADPGFIANPTYVFRADGAVPTAAPSPEPTEAITEIVLIPRTEAGTTQWLKEIPDAISRAAILEDLQRSQAPCQLTHQPPPHTS